MADIATNDLTPSRKRKRDYEKVAETCQHVCFNNPAFNASSTPKKIVGRRRLLPAVKENLNPLNTCMEVKSIAELVEKQKKQNIQPLNPYEVQRKPPKKKKREAAIEEACFENPALNLNVPEKQFNPYEVVRDVNKNHEDQRKCFVNAALDIKGKDAVVNVRNPFEIDREDIRNDSEHKKASSESYENFGINSIRPTSLKIGIPFTPTVGCRIDFNNIPLTQLTPSKLLLTEKLVFSPVLTKPKRSLESISEESSSVSIGKELDRYQLELENSINEAKIRKHDTGTDGVGVVEKECVYQLQFKVEKRVSLGTKLSDIVESEEYEIDNTAQINVTELKTKADLETTSGNQTVETPHKVELEKPNNKKHEADLNNYNNCNAGFSFDSDDEEDKIDFKAPAPFVRAYRRDNNVVSKSNSKESLNSNSSTKASTENIAVTKNKNTVKNLIRRSIRKILPNNQHHKEEVDSDLKLMNEASETKESNEEKQCKLTTSHIMSSLRQSLRRKPKPQRDSEPSPGAANLLAEISIIDTSERKLKLKSSLGHNEYARIEELTNEKKHSLRQNRLRHSTREMRHQIMNTFFYHKQDEYSFKK